MEFALLLALLAWGPASAALGKSKGFSAVTCYFAGFLLGIFGLLGVALWPARKAV